MAHSRGRYSMFLCIAQCCQHSGEAGRLLHPAFENIATLYRSPQGLQVQVPRRQAAAVRSACRPELRGSACARLVRARLQSIFLAPRVSVLATFTIAHRSAGERRCWRQGPGRQACPSPTQTFADHGVNLRDQTNHLQHTRLFIGLACFAASSMCSSCAVSSGLSGRVMAIAARRAAPRAHRQYRQSLCRSSGRSVTPRFRVCP